jgi:siroheme synthase
MPGADSQATIDKLASAGVPLHTPCALISRASTSAQQTTVTTLEKLATIRAQAKPSILILGDVVRLSKLGQLDFHALSTELVPAQIPGRRQEAELA